jgi:hypothetical protein
MPWVKRGLILSPSDGPGWGQHSTHTLTPWLRDSSTVRVFTGFRDAEGISRIGYVDVDAGNPRRVLGISTAPALDVGRPGSFDDNGLIPGDVVERDDGLYLFYAGFQLVKKAKFLFFTGLAVSRNRGNTFERVSEAPVLDRADEGLFVRTVTSAMWDEGKWKIWYAAGSEWTVLDGNPYPNYLVCHQDSDDPKQWGRQGIVCIRPQGTEYRVGRPRVYKRNGRYEMFFTYGTREGARLPGWATSVDGKHWERRDSELALGPSGGQSWDSEEFCYPALVTSKQKNYMFYNGNGMGRTGFGYAEWE